MSLRRYAPVATVAIAALLLASCMNADAQSAFDKVNAERSARGLWSLGVNEELTQKGQGWAQNLLDSSGGICSSNTLRHSNLASGAPAGWRSLGENVGCAVTFNQADGVQTIHSTFMNSTGHRGNILSSVFNYGGFGVASRQLPNGAWLTFEAQEFAAL